MTDEHHEHPFEHVEIPESPLEQAQLRVMMARREYAQDPDSAWEPLVAAIDAMLPLMEQPNHNLTASSSTELHQERESIFKARPLVLKTWQDHLNPPPREWLVEDWLPANRVTLFWGIAGGGKSYMAVQLAAGISSGGGEENRWIHSPSGIIRLGNAVRTGLPVVFCSWEDEEEEFGRRLIGIRHPKHAYWVTPERTSEFYFTYLAGRGPLWSPEEGRHTSTLSRLTPAGEATRRTAEQVGARLLILDPLAAVYAANESDRGLVRSFVADWDAWAQQAGCAVLLLAHPNKDGIQSGSTDWRGACRSVWELSQEEFTKTPRENRDARDLGWKLRLGKGNYSPYDTALHLKWDSDQGTHWDVVGDWEDSARAQRTTNRAQTNKKEPRGGHESRLI